MPPPGPSPSDLLLVPTPQRVTQHGGFVTLPTRVVVSGAPSWLVDPALTPAMETAGITHAHNGADPHIKLLVDTPLDLPAPHLREQRYALSISPAATPGGPAVRVAAPSYTALRYALHTLAQLLRRFGRRLPCLTIDDQPASPVRGAMIDVSRCRIPTTAALTTQIDTLAALKINHLQLYTEHTFAYAGHEQAWRGWSPITPDEMRAIDAHCRLRGIELAANQNCFGHLSHWLSLPPYAHLAETHGDWVFDVWPRSGPWSLCPTDPASAGFVAGLLDQLLPCVQGGLCNIGCDEVYDIAYGRSKPQVDARGRAAVFVEFVNTVCGLVRARAKRPMFWADMLTSQPQQAASLDPCAVALVWGYEPDSDLAAQAAPLVQAGREAWVCPGTSSWLTFFGRTSERRANIARATRQGLAAGAAGVLTTDWGDSGHRQQRPIGLLGLAHGAAAAWNVDEGEGFDPRAASLHVLDDPSLASGPWIESMGDIDAPLRACTLGLSRPGLTGALRNSSPLMVDLNLPVTERREVGDLALWRATADKLADARVPSTITGVLRDELEHALDGARLAAARAVARRYNGGLSPQARHLLADQARRVASEHRRLWLTWCRPGGLDRSASWYERVAAELA